MLINGFLITVQTLYYQESVLTVVPIIHHFSSNTYSYPLFTCIPTPVVHPKFAFDETMQLLLCWFISPSSSHIYQPSQLLTFEFCKKFIHIVLIFLSSFCNPIPFKYQKLLIFVLSAPDVTNK